ncbi:hypothetical protein V8C86DRAFT_130963 [Haematococcus lacustris]
MKSGVSRLAAHQCSLNHSPWSGVSRSRSGLVVVARNRILVGVVGGPRATAQLLSPRSRVALPTDSTTGSMELQITEWLADLPSPRVDLLLALPRPKVLRRLWPVLGELGVGQVVLTGAERVEKTYWAAGAALDPAQEHDGSNSLISPVGNKYSCGGGVTEPALGVEPDNGGSQPMTLQPPLKHVEQAEDVLAGTSHKAQELEGGGHVCKLVAHPCATTPLITAVIQLYSCMAGTVLGFSGISDMATGTAAGVGAQTPVPGAHPAPRVVLAIGPEGGWRDAELQLLEDDGFLPVSLGPRVLTTTSAVIAGVGSIAQALAHLER